MVTTSISILVSWARTVNQRSHITVDASPPAMGCPREKAEVEALTWNDHWPLKARGRGEGALQVEAVKHVF